MSNKFHSLPFNMLVDAKNAKEQSILNRDIKSCNEISNAIEKGHNGIIIKHHNISEEFREFLKNRGYKILNKIDGYEIRWILNTNEVENA